MGLCGSSESNASPQQKDQQNEERRTNKAVDSVQKSAEIEESKVNKLLLLGTGASGKSTLFKQMITIYGKGFPENERKTYTNIIFNNVLVSMRTLCKNSVKYHDIDPSLSESKTILEQEMKEDQPITLELAEHVKKLWADPGIQITYDHQNEFQLTDSAKFFFEKIDTLASPTYIPTEQDVLRSRAPTTGIVENEFVIDGNHFKMFDVGGQRNERKKWIHCFENVTAVIFVAAMSEYNQVLYEDETMNRLKESLNLFEEICNSKWFRKTSMILFLNKRDIFMDKIQKFPLSEQFPEYTGGNNFDEASEWIQQQFEEKNEDQDKQIYTHITCATDTENVLAVFNAVKDIIIRKNLGRVGLL